MLKFVMGFLVIALCCMVIPVPAVLAEEAKYELKTPTTAIRDVLIEQTGKRVILRLDSGEAMEGTVVKVGENVVHIAKLSGKDFYDAVVRIERISAVLLRVRDK